MTVHSLCLLHNLGNLSIQLIQVVSYYLSKNLTNTATGFSSSPASVMFLGAVRFITSIATISLSCIERPVLCRIS
uniref:Uncharacterized protein n=1 Tax=uncultured marine virus TaxID=186617 RepID=A0A0F7L683_9VIRU|nr:hypothetical protein [uncultured marine virus]